MTEYIKRQSAIDLLWKDGRITMSGIKAIPAAEVSPVVHGRWIYSPSEIFGIDIQKCSVCGNEMTERNQFWSSNYCPNCGAKMDKEETNGD